MNNQFRRLLNMARVTGDRLIVLDEQSGEPFVIMGIDDYEFLVENAFYPEDWNEGEEIPLDLTDMPFNEAVDQAVDSGDHAFSGQDTHSDLPAEGINHTDTEIVNIDDDSSKEKPVKEGEKFYFEEIDEEQENK